MDFCDEKDLYLLVHQGLIDDLLGLLPHAFPAVEIYAGNGKLSYWLREHDFPIQATDDYGLQAQGTYSSSDYVEHLSYERALERDDPALVIGAYITHMGRTDLHITIDSILSHHSVKHFLHLGNAIRHEKPGWEIHEFMLSPPVYDVGDGKSILYSRMPIFSSSSAAQSGP